MAAILAIIYAFYFVMVGAAGNANQFLTLASQEKVFLYWVIVLLIVAALWNLGGVGSKFGPAFAGLIVVGFLLANKNGLTILHNAQQILPGLGGSVTATGTSTPAGATGAAGGLT